MCCGKAWPNQSLAVSLCVLVAAQARLTRPASNNICLVHRGAYGGPQSDYLLRSLKVPLLILRQVEPCEWSVATAQRLIISGIDIVSRASRRLLPTVSTRRFEMEVPVIIMLRVESTRWTAKTLIRWLWFVG